jgi:hypothetical protein
MSHGSVAFETGVGLGLVSTEPLPPQDIADPATIDERKKQRMENDREGRHLGCNSRPVALDNERDLKPRADSRKLNVFTHQTLSKSNTSGM